MSKTILSFDVGIINLAYCILEKKEENFTIKDWGIINIDSNKLTCSHLNKKGQKCSKNAKYSLHDTTEDKMIYFCKGHCKNKDIKCPTKDIEKNNLVCSHPKKCKNECIKELENKPYCEKHITVAEKQFIKSQTAKKIACQNSNHRSVDTLAQGLYKSLDAKTHFLTADEVIIENQPSLLNPTMKTIASLLYGYFTLRGVVDKEKNKSNINQIKFISPQNKLKINKENTDKTLKKAKTKREEYMLTKTLGKRYCRAIIESDKDNLKYLDSMKKNDDLADSFLQGFYYLFYANSTLPDKYMKILDTLITDENLVKKDTKTKKKDKSKKGIDLTNEIKV